MADENIQPGAAPEGAPAVDPKTVVHSSDGAPQIGFQSTSVTDPVDGGRPEWLPEGVDKVEDLKGWYEAQEAARNKPEGATEDAQVVDAQGEEKPAEEAPKGRTDEEIKTALKEAGGIFADPNYEPFAIAFERNGDLTPAEITDAAAKFAGGNEEAIKSFLAVQKENAKLRSEQGSVSQMAIDTANATQAAALVAVIGDQAEWGKFQEWSATGLTKEEADTYNKSDPETAKILLAAFKQRYQQAGYGKPGRDITKEGQPSAEGSRGGPQPYASNEEMTADIASKQYRDDPAFRAKVLARAGVTK